MKSTFLITTTALCLLGAAPHRSIAAKSDSTVQVTDEVRAEKWGFNKEDATDALQAAINSGAKKVIVGKMDSDWVISRTIELASHQEIVFEDGVILRAKEDQFKGLGDALLRGRNVTGVTVRGEGKVTLKMLKTDYQDPERYRLGEWRHVINLSGCTDVTVRNLTLADSGGDGIYVGSGEKPYCENILIEEVDFENHHRLGMAVISAQNLTIRRCRFRFADGASPEGGLDFEPNRPTERLVNCVVEDCVFENNPRGAGIAVSPNHLNSESEPVSVTIRRSRLNHNALGAFLYPSRRSKTDPVKGKVEFIDCEMVGNTNASLLFQDPTANGVEFLFTRCTIDNTAAMNPAAIISCRESVGRSIGNIRFDETVITDHQERQPLVIRYNGNGQLSDEITGTLYTMRDGKKVRVDLPAYLKEKQAVIAKINALKPVPLDLSKASASGTTDGREGNTLAYLRGRFTFVQYAKQGEEITLYVNVAQVGKYYGDTDFKLLAPDGGELKSYKVPAGSSDFPVSFTAKETGIYRLVCAGTVQRVDIASKHRGNGILLEEHQTFLPIAGKFYFQVPAGVKDFSIGVSADAGADVTLLNAEGKPVEATRRVDSMELLSGSREASDKDEIWALQFDKVGWHLTLRFGAPLHSLVSTDPKTLLLIPSL